MSNPVITKTEIKAADRPDFTVEEAINKNIKFIYKQAHRYKKFAEFDDLVQCGVCGLIEAYGRFDASKKEKKTNFLSYAFFFIRNHMLQYVKSNSKLINFTSLIGDNEYDFDSVHNWAGTEENNEFDNVPENNDTKAYMAKLFKGDLLCDRERFILQNRYLNHEKQTFKVLAEKLNISIPMVKIIESGALKKLKNSINNS